MSSEIKNTTQEHSSTNAQEHKQNYSNAIIEVVKNYEIFAIIRNNGLDSKKNCKIVAGSYALTEYEELSYCIDEINSPSLPTVAKTAILMVEIMKEIKNNPSL